MKAYSVTDRTECIYSTIVFAETAGQARAIAMGTDACEDVPFIDIWAKRVPKLDAFYKGRSELDWNNDEDRIAMVRYAGYSCAYEDDVSIDECKECPAHEWCDRYEDMIDA